jgi:hypothetical protein
VRIRSRAGTVARHRPCRGSVRPDRGYASALEVAADGTTVNPVLPAGVNTDFIHNNAMDKVLRPDLDNQTRQDVMPLFEVARAAGAAGRLQRARLAADLGQPHLVLRLGTSDPHDAGPPHAPRLPADQIMLSPARVAARARHPPTGMAALGMRARPTRAPGPDGARFL